MSIATLKKKSRALFSGGNNYNTVSVAGVGFMLNGTIRNISVLPAQDMKPYTRTPFRGTEPMGHGGGSRCRVSGWRARKNHCSRVGNDYPQIISNSGNFYTGERQPHKSVLNTKGMLENRYTGILHGAYPRTWVQPTQTNDSSTYTASLSSQPFSPGCIGTAPDWNGSGFNATGEGSIEKHATCPTNYSGQPLPYSKNLNLLRRDYSTYYQKVTAQCYNPLCSQKPFPFKVSNGVCSMAIKTKEQAEQEGQLCGIVG